MSQYFAINTPPVVQETIDQEVIIANLDSGSYYSLDGVAARIWNLLERGASVAAIQQDLAATYEIGTTNVEAVVTQLLGEFQQENLIVPSDKAVTPVGAIAPMPAGAPNGQRLPFTPPVLNKYTDMQDLLMLDPVHEVDETGWPSAKPRAN